MNTTVSILIVDDDAMVRAGLSMVLSADPTITIVAEAPSGADAVAAAIRHRPDVVLMDLQMPEMNGVEATRRIHHAVPSAAVLMLTTFHLDTHVLDALQAGASGYLLKDVAPQELCHAIHLAAAGESAFSATITRQLVARQARSRGDDGNARAARTLAVLTERERAVAEAVAEGAANATIAKALFMSEGTVKTHISRALTKTGLDNRVQLALLVFRAQQSR
ncbi:DNA-binding response regulator [Actinocatenispora thailandica]|uniref:DNA-binding response regulator n=1 Tax=Actinocatenispora thailandica TaxID=227318 RepID=A0A7R7DWM6_9ACTN|nr:response regulator transcription factor [Actinocatenispora thailandica]BCJ39238.1 DNA-binding response regulator [Actinocatenispora thailandica]